MPTITIRFVRFLTNASWKCRHAGMAAAILLANAPAGAVDALMPDWHPVPEIAAAAETYMQSEVASESDQIMATAGHLDSRLQLPRCHRPLEVRLAPGTKRSARTTVSVHCSGNKPWKIYVPVYVAVMKNVLIARKSMARGHLIRPEDVEIVTRDISGLIGGYLTQVDDITGQRLRRAVAGGEFIGPSLLQAEFTIRKGQSVTLTANNDSLDIRMAGRALMNGTIDQRIRVKNTHSGRVVEGLVRSSEHVEVLVY